MEQQKIYCLHYKRALRLNLYHGKTTVIRDKKKSSPGITSKTALSYDLKFHC